MPRFLAAAILLLLIVPARAEDWQRGLDQRQGQRQHQRVMSGFRDHGNAPGFGCGAARSACGALGSACGAL